jgi:hypothetical protein
MQADEDMIRATSRPTAPYVVPADHKAFTQLAAAAALIEALEPLDPSLPKIGRRQLKEKERIRAVLVRGP